jgi:uncharacterized membrane protein
MSSSHLLVGANAPAQLEVRHITPSDVLQALARGLDDFAAMPSHALFLCVFYPLIGLCLIAFVSGDAMLPLAFPIAAGFALVGPFAAIGLYELSRRREAGLDTSSNHALDVLHSRSIGAILALGILLMLIFLVWVAVADAIYVANFGYNAPASVGKFVSDIFTTSAGWNVIVVGTIVGFLFAVVVLTISAISFPLLLDRDVGAAVAVFTSIRVVLANPVTMALWGLIVAFLLVAGSLPFFLGLTVVMPVLGHATWHLYRKGRRVRCRAECRASGGRAAAAATLRGRLPRRAVSDAALEAPSISACRNGGRRDNPGGHRDESGCAGVG